MNLTSVSIVNSIMEKGLWFFYVIDMFIFGIDPDEVEECKNFISRNFDMKDL